MNPKPPTCGGCPAYNKGLGFVPATGPSDATVAWIGQGPGPQEAQFSVPFFPQAPAGRMATRWIYRGLGAQRTALHISNVVWCYLPKRMEGSRGVGSRPPTEAELAHCWRHHVAPALPETVTHIIAVGAPATRWLTGVTGAVERYMGVTMEVELPDA